MICQDKSSFGGGLDLSVERQTSCPLRGDPREVAMHQGKLVFAQVMAHLPLSTFRRCVARRGEHKVKSSRAWISSSRWPLRS